MLKWLFLLTLLAFVSRALTTECAKVWLTVSSLWKTKKNSTAVVDSELEVNWRYSCEDFTELVIKIFDDDPTKNEHSMAASLSIPTNRSEGFFRTGVFVDRNIPSEGWNNNTNADFPGAHCLKHYAALYINNNIKAYSCLKIRPTWMRYFREKIGHLPIGSLMIPGTHNSGCYYEGNLTIFDISGFGYVLTQDRNVWTQLVYGVRYLDLRVGWYSLISNDTSLKYNDRQDDHFWINHDIVRVRPLLEVLKEVRHFMDSAPEEIMILDFHRFPIGFTGKLERHRALVSILVREFGDLIFPLDRRIQTYGPTLNDIWKSGKRLIISYGDKHMVNEYDFLWPQMTQAWGNKQNLNDLLQYMESMLFDPNKSKNNNPVWALMAELTPQIWDIIFRVSGNLRQLADLVNRNLTMFFENNSTFCHLSNVVATDFFLGNNLIDVSIESNVQQSNNTKS